jgi:hypothetical protein
MNKILIVLLWLLLTSCTSQELHVYKDYYPVNKSNTAYWVTYNEDIVNWCEFHVEYKPTPHVNYYLTVKPTHVKSPPLEPSLRCELQLLQVQGKLKPVKAIIYPITTNGEHSK